MAKNITISEAQRVARQRIAAMFSREASMEVSCGEFKVNLIPEVNYSLVLLLAGENLNCGDTERFTTINQLAHFYAQAALSRLWRLKFSKGRDPFTLFIKNFLKSSPEAGLKKYIKRQLLKNEELTDTLESEGYLLGAKMRKLLLNNAAALLDEPQVEEEEEEESEEE